MSALENKKSKAKIVNKGGAASRVDKVKAAP